MSLSPLRSKYSKSGKFGKYSKSVLELLAPLPAGVEDLWERPKWAPLERESLA
jgi:hypothetical protein